MKKNKTLYRVLVLTGFILINAGILFGISQVIAYLNTGADRDKMLHLDIDQERYYVPQVTWESTINPGRPLEIANQQKIEKDYLNAWYVKNTAFFTGNDAGIFDHYTASARDKIDQLLRQHKEQNTSIESTSLSHHLTLEFYSEDGTLAVLTDRNVTGVERMFKNEQFLFERTFNEDYKIILLLEDGFWRIRHFEKIAVHQIDEQLTSVTLDTKLLEGINYYPQENPWDTFGEHFDSDILDDDFKIIKDLKLNSIRVFIGYEDFGKASASQDKLDKLTILLDEANKVNLKVIITLFDFYGDYRLQDWTVTNKHLFKIVTHIKSHPALLAWDIKNEPDLDFDSRGKREVLSWLHQSIDYLKKIDSIHPVTIGWSSPESALHLEDKVDIISYHYYKDLEGLATVHKELTASTRKLVVLQEIGLSSYRGLWNPFGHSEKDQTAFYKELLTIQKTDNIPFITWTLYDFKEIPQKVAGDYPWRRNKQKHFGLINEDGTETGSFTIIKDR